MPIEGCDGQFSIPFPPEVRRESNEDNQEIKREEEGKKMEAEEKRIEAVFSMAEEEVSKLSPDKIKKFEEVIDNVLKSRTKRVEKNISMSFLLDFISGYKKISENKVYKNEVDEDNEHRSLVKIFSYLLMQKPGYVFSDSLLRFLEERDSSMVEKVGGRGRPVGKVVKEGGGSSQERRNRNARREAFGAGRGLPTGDLD